MAKPKNSGLQPPTASTIPKPPGLYPSTAVKSAGNPKALQDAMLQSQRYAGRAQQEYENKQAAAQADQQRRYDSSSGANPYDALQRIKMQADAKLQGQRYAGRAAQEYENGLANLALAPVAPLPNAPSGPGSPGSSGGGGGSVAPQQTLEELLAGIPNITGVIDPRLARNVPTSGELDLMYQRLVDANNANRARSEQDYATGKANVSANYDQSNNLIQQAISGDQASLAAAAANFGINQQDWQSGRTAQSETDLLNRLIGSGTQNEAVDLAWFEKMGLLDQSQFADYNMLAGVEKNRAMTDAKDTMLQLQQLADQQAQAEAMAALAPLMGGGGSGGGGGGGRRGGGGGGGSSSKDPYGTWGQSASSTTTQQFAGLNQMLSQMDPGLAAIAQKYWIWGGSSGEGAAKAILQDIVQGNSRFGGNTNALDYIYQNMMNFVPGLGAITTEQSKDSYSSNQRQYGVASTIPGTPGYQSGVPQIPQATPASKSIARVIGAIARPKTPPVTDETKKKGLTKSKAKKAFQF